MKLTEREKQVIEFIKAKPSGKRLLYKFHDVIPIRKGVSNHQWMRAGYLGRMEKKGLIRKIKPFLDKPIYYYCLL